MLSALPFCFIALKSSVSHHCIEPSFFLFLFSSFFKLSCSFHLVDVSILTFRLIAYVSICMSMFLSRIMRALEYDVGPAACRRHEALFAVFFRDTNVLVCTAVVGS